MALLERLVLSLENETYERQTNCLRVNSTVKLFRSSPCGIAGDIQLTVCFLLYPISLDDRATSTVSAGSVRLAKAEKNNSTPYIAGEWHGNTIQGS